MASDQRARLNSLARTRWSCREVTDTALRLPSSHASSAIERRLATKYDYII